MQHIVAPCAKDKLSSVHKTEIDVRKERNMNDIIQDFAKLKRR